MAWYWLVVGSLAVWRVTHLIHAEDGPWLIVARVRRSAGHGCFGSLLDCFYCLSVWVAALPAFLLGHTWLERAFLLPALSGAAILIERLTAPQPPIPQYSEDPEVSDGLLRTEPDSGGSSSSNGGKLDGEA